MGATYGELEVGKKYLSLPVTITEAHLVLFGGLIGNWHPSHLNLEFSQRGPFRKRVCHGELTCGLMLSGFAQLLSDTSLGHLGGTYRLKAPVYVGDTIYTEMEVLSKRPSRSRPGGIVQFGLKTYNQDGLMVAEGTADFLVANESIPLYSPETPAGKASQDRPRGDG